MENQTIANQFIETIKTASEKKLCIKVTYNSKVRTIEPYSLTVSKQGNVNLYGLHREEGLMKAFTVSKISDLEVTSLSFGTSEADKPKPKRGRPAGSKNKSKTTESNVVFTKPVLVSFNKNAKVQKSKAKVSFMKGGQYDDLQWLRNRMIINKKNEDRVRAERSGKNKNIVNSLDKRK